MEELSSNCPVLSGNGSQRRHDMRCVTCNKKTVPGRSRCGSCLEASRGATARYRLKYPERAKVSDRASKTRHVMAGRCPECGHGKLKVGRKRCGRCLAKHRNGTSLRRSARADAGLCRECGAKAGGPYCRACLDKVRDRQRALRREIVTAYGSACACCGEREPMFLHIDHMNGVGRHDRLIGLVSATFYRRLRAAGFPRRLSTAVREL